ncbi:multi-sensor hybrid histidine kinase [Desulfatibacillum aliphaticivorans]|uniref:histidine kinase n=1 Tax=Desulfatibacillum aliphaticivorans TaxID=218208 RepID=B8FI11_DESAL|nr:response regulator [Desulfatibacillum aliphaticivorans]ACL02578.1 multi-sensor hybrid histidine kinase [Desulfatibacillum aliphaticivorans]
MPENIWTWWSRLESKFMPAHARDAGLLTFWRERILMVIFLSAVFLGPLALVPSLTLAFFESKLGVAGLDFLAYAAAVFLLLKRDAPLRFRAWFAYGMFYILGVGLILILGPNGAGYIWLFGASVLAGSMVNFRAAVWTLVVNFVTLLGIGGLIYYGRFSWADKIDNVIKVWMVMSVNFILINAIVTLATAIILRGLENALVNEYSISHDLRLSEEKHRTILESIEEGYYEVDLAGSFLFFNPGLCKILGYTKAELSGKNYREILTEKTAQIAYEKFSDVYRTGEPSKVADWIMIKKDGSECAVEASISLIKDLNDKPAGFRGVARDVTENLRLLEADQKRQLAEAASLAKSDFLARMSHEIRTPLNAVVGMAELASNEKMNQNLKKIIETITSESNALVALVNRILDFSKIEAQKMELEEFPFDLGYLLEDIADSMGLEAYKKGLEFILHINPEIPVQVKGDPGRIRQVLTNLIGNAIKFTSEGEVFVKAELETRTDEKAIIKFHIQDTGIGIPEEKRGLIFEAFTQADDSTTRKYGGTGLGTTISKKIVELMGGEIGLESREGCGSIFWFTVVLALQQVKRVPVISPEYDIVGKKILVIENNLSYREVIQSYLLSWGGIVDTAPNIEEAIRYLESQSSQGEKPALIVMDLNLPSLIDLDLAGSLKRSPLMKGIPLIVLTNVGRMGDGKKCRELGIDGYLAKPVRRDDLCKVVRVVLGLARQDLPDQDSQLVTRHFASELNRSNISILLVEDYPANQFIAMEHLTSDGYRVALAENGQKAVEAFRKKTFDLVFMDIQMPIMDGYEATKQIRALEAENAGEGNGDGSKKERCPIIAMTAHAFNGYREKCLEADMDDYITKPISKKELLEIAARWSPSARRLEQGNDSTYNLDAPCRKTAMREEPASNTTSAPPLDIEAVVEEFMGKRELVIKIAGNFADTVQGQLVAIQKALHENNMHAIASEAHAIKGGAANLTAEKLSEAAAALEDAARSENADIVAGLAENLSEKFHILKDFLKNKGFLN